ncbi:MAG: DUF4255 domain-containing protein [Pseudomonadota bacterium]|nr:DUF4255 domain-containing protein [Pseudomonadota bacterium]
MALLDTKTAIGAVSNVLKSRLTTRTTAVTVDIGRPEQAAKSSNGPKFNLFLYQVDIDGHMRNQTLDNGQAPPLWLVLHYLMTAFDQHKESDNDNAHELLGEGMLALQELNYLDPASITALADNPEPLKVSFDTADAELLSKVMQGSDEQYRISTAFQIRPVLIAPSKPPAYSLPVETVGPPGNEGVVVIPSLGPRLDRLEPVRFQLDDEIVLYGEDIGSEIDAIRLGDTEFPVTAAMVGEVHTIIDPAIAVSAGSYPVTAVRNLPGGKKMISNAVFGHLLPTVDTVVPSGLVDHSPGVSGTLTIQGNNLGTGADNIYVAFYNNGVVGPLFEATVNTAQTEIAISVSQDDEIQAGFYSIVVRVNGEQAGKIVQVDWSV